MTPDCFLCGWFFKITVIFSEAVLTSNKSCSKCFLIVFTSTLNKHKEFETSKEQIN